MPEFARIRGLRRIVETRVRTGATFVLDRVGRSRHAESWKSDAVAGKMRALARQQLAAPEPAPPYRAFLEAIRVLTREFPLPAPARLVDIGCGTGHYSELLDRYFPRRFDYTGCDFAPEMVESARAEWPGRVFVVNDVLDNALDLGAYDVVLAGGLVDVLPDYRRALDVLLGSAAPYVILHRQRVTHGRSRVDVVQGYPGQRTHRTSLNRAELEAVAARLGRRIVRTFPVEGPIFTFLLAGESSSCAS